MAPYISPFHHVLDSVANPLYDTMALEPDEMWMHLALQEARRGVGHTTPNPPVGCVLVRDGTLLSKGYHHFAGAPHAEAAAITQAGVSLNRSTAYVTLEPCNHQGRTSPCTDRLISAGVSRVVIGAIDPNPRVNGAGIQKLRASGIQVDIIDGPFGDYAKALIAPFASSITKGLPWVTLKSAVSLDGGIAAEEGVCTPITGLQTKQVVHRLRSCVDAVLIGERTAKIDDPRLTVRNTGAWSYEKAESKKIILSTNLSLPKSLRLITENPANTLIAHGPNVPQKKRQDFLDAGVTCLEVAVDERSGRVDLKELLRHLHSMRLQSVLVEPGQRLLASMMDNGLWDEIYWFAAPKWLGAKRVAVARDLGQNTFEVTNEVQNNPSRANYSVGADSLTLLGRKA